MKNIVGTALAILLLATGCNSNSPTKTPQEKPIERSIMEATDPRLLNGIEIKENGLQIVSARLLKEDGTLLEPGNPVDVGEIIYCQLFIAGWHVENGIVKPGAYEIIQTKEKEIILGEEDLFKSVTGASEEEARVVTLRAGITNSTNPAKEFEVIFRIWDKVSQAELSGSFQFHLR